VWEVTDTVHPDRKNLFCMSPGREHHVGTIVSGSRSKLDRFEDEVRLISVAPQMRDVLQETLALLDGFELADNPEAALVKRRIRLLLGELGTTTET
jgi:hypothetical protein